MFLVVDKSYPQSEEIYALMKMLYAKMRDEECVLLWWTPDLFSTSKTSRRNIAWIPQRSTCHCIQDHGYS